MNTADVIRELDKRIRSRVSVIYIVTQEERRVIEAIARYAEQPVHSLAGQQILPRRQVWRWDMTRGIVPLCVDAADLVAEIPETDPLSQVFAIETADPQAAMEAIGRYAQGNGANAGTTQGMTDAASIFLMLDLHRHISGHADEGVGEPAFQRSLRNLYGKLVATRSVAIIISPRMVELGDCEGEVSVLDWPLPDQEELTALIQGIGDKLPAHIPTDLNGGTARLANALAGLTLEDAESALLGAVFETGGLIPDQVIPHVIRAKSEAVSKAAGLEYIDHSETLGSVGGLDLLKQAVANLDSTMTREALAQHVEPIDGVLLVGVPGCGKSLMAKAISGGTKPCIRQNVGEQFTSLLGGTEANMRNAFRVLEAIGPSVWHIDEIEKLFGGGQGETDGGTGRRVLGMLLTFMEERKQRAPFVLPVVTANDVSSIPPELLNRFELVFFVDLPDEVACQEIIRIHLRKRGLTSVYETDVQKLARIAHGRGLNGREIERAIKAAHRRAYSTGQALLDTLTTAFENAVGVAQTMPEKINAIREWGRRHALPASSTQEAAAVSAKDAGLLL